MDAINYKIKIDYDVESYKIDVEYFPVLKSGKIGKPKTVTYKVKTPISKKALTVKCNNIIEELGGSKNVIDMAITPIMTPNTIIYKW